MAARGVSQSGRRVAQRHTALPVLVRPSQVFAPLPPYRAPLPSTAHDAACAGPRTSRGRVLTGGMRCTGVRLIRTERTRQPTVDRVPTVVPERPEPSTLRAESRDARTGAGFEFRT